MGHCHVNYDHQTPVAVDGNIQISTSKLTNESHDCKTVIFT